MAHVSPCGQHSKAQQRQQHGMGEVTCEVAGAARHKEAWRQRQVDGLVNAQRGGHSVGEGNGK